MKILKIVLIIIVAIVALFLIVAAFLPSTARTSRSITINAPVDSVFKIVADYSYYEQWNPWSAMDREATGQFSGPAGQPGQKWTWEGEVIGSGSLTTIKVIDNKYIEADLVFTAPREDRGKDIWEFETLSSTTRVTWTNVSELDYPVGRYMGLFLDSMLGPSFEQGLENIKKMAENM